MLNGSMRIQVKIISFIGGSLLSLTACGATVSGGSAHEKNNKTEAAALAAPVSAAAPEIPAQPKQNNLWLKSKTVETPYYSFAILPSWQKFPNMSRGQEQVYSINTLNLPARINGSAAFSTVYITKETAETEEAFEAQFLKQFGGANAASIKESKHNGWPFYIIETPLAGGRRSTLYSILSYSEKAQAGYIYTVNVRYAGTRQDLTEQYRLDEAAKEIFNGFSLK